MGPLKLLFSFVMETTAIICPNQTWNRIYLKIKFNDYDYECYKQLK